MDDRVRVSSSSMLWEMCRGGHKNTEKQKIINNNIMFAIGENKVWIVGVSTVGSNALCCKSSATKTWENEGEFLLFQTSRIRRVPTTITALIHENKT